VATFAYGQRHPVVDTNVRRLVARARLGRPDGGRATAAADLRTVLDLLPVSPARAARASAALMELGALVCTARQPSCSDCPLRMTCAWHLAGRPALPRGTRRSQGYQGTDRQVRGLILALVRHSSGPVSESAVVQLWSDQVQLARALSGLLADGLLVEIEAVARIPG